MAYEVKIIEDSISENRGDVGDVRLTTLQLTYPRYIHAEFLTHRAFSRNASSSRAIPVSKMSDIALAEMVEPIRYGLNQPGMQSLEANLDGETLESARKVWRRMAEECVRGAKELSELGLHKQWANRPLEWFSNIRVVMTATEMANFFELRTHKDAQPEIQELAFQIHAAMDQSKPKLLKSGEWHLPYVKEEERHSYTLDVLLKMSAARCARVSYLTHDGQNPNVEKDIKLYDQLITSKPMHASPIEHQATPMNIAQELKYEFSGNFKGWLQHRKLVEQNFAA